MSDYQPSASRDALGFGYESVSSSSLAPDPGSAQLVEYAGRIRELIAPQPGEVWLRDSEERPVIITGVTWGRISWIQPQAAVPGYAASYGGSHYFFAEEWTRLWPPDGRLPS